MLVPAPYKAPKKKAEKEAKETSGGLRRCGASDAKSEDSNAHPSSEEEEEDEEDESLVGGERKGRPPHPWRPNRLRGEKPPPLPEVSATAADSSPEWDPRAQPLVNS